MHARFIQFLCNYINLVIRAQQVSTLLRALRHSSVLAFANIAYFITGVHSNKQFTSIARFIDSEKVVLLPGRINHTKYSSQPLCILVLPLIHSYIHTFLQKILKILTLYNFYIAIIILFKNYFLTLGLLQHISEMAIFHKKHAFHSIQLHTQLTTTFATFLVAKVS